MSDRVPNPRPHATIEDPADVPEVRRLHCRSYNTCLDLADARRWVGFACTGCAAFEPQTPEQEATDHLALLRVYGRAGGYCEVNESATRAAHHQEEG